MAKRRVLGDTTGLSEWLNHYAELQYNCRREYAQAEEAYREAAKLARRAAEGAAQPDRPGQ